MFDCVIVTASLVLEAGRVGDDSWLDANLLIILRAWRIARLLNVAKLALRNEVRQLKEDLLVERGKVNKFKRLVKNMQRNEETFNRRYLTLRKELRLSKKNLTALMNEAVEGGETFDERERHLQELFEARDSGPQPSKRISMRATTAM